MNYVQADKLFREEYPNILKIAREDYCKAQFIWESFKDTLNRDGSITDKQFANWQCPFKKRG